MRPSGGLAGIGITTIGWLWIDPLVSLVIVAFILVSTWGLLEESMNLALQAVPAGIDMKAVSDYSSRLSGVTAVHDRHIWAISTTETALTADLVKSYPIDDDVLITEARRGLFENFGIDDVILQWERSDSNWCNAGRPATPKKFNGGWLFRDHSSFKILKMAPASDQYTVLIIEDDPNTAALVALYLKREGFRVLTAGDGKTGLALAGSTGRIWSSWT